jgi:hypothetical protein
MGGGFMKALRILVSMLVLLFFMPAFLVCASEEMMEETEEGMDMEMMDAEEGMMYVFEVMINNVHDMQPLSPGVFVVHTGDLSMNFEGQMAPPGLEPLAEYGSTDALAEYVADLDGAIKVFTIGGPTLPGMDISTTVEFQTTEMPVYLSGAMMDAATNDGFALLDAVMLVDENGTALSSTTDTQNYDAGTEENTALGSGFEGGQPDPSRGEENIDNGVPTEEPVSMHPQLNETVMEVVITAL